MCSWATEALFGQLFTPLLHQSDLCTNLSCAQIEMARKAGLLCLLHTAAHGVLLVVTCVLCLVQSEGVPPAQRTV